MEETKRKSISKAVVYFVLIITSVIMLYPFLWMVSGSFKSLSGVVGWPPRLFPEKWMFENYITALTTMNFWRAIINSTIYSLVTAILCVIVSAFAAFGFAKYSFFGREFFFLLIIITIMFPIEITVIPLYMVLKDLKWLNSYHGLIVPRIAQGFGIFLLRQHFRTIPDSYLDAARIDSCSEIALLWRVISPLSKPTLLIVGLFTFLWRWNELLWPMIVVQDPKMHTVQVALTSFIGDPRFVYWHHLLAGITIACLPGIILFFFLQKYIIKGIIISGLKG